MRQIVTCIFICVFCSFPLALRAQLFKGKVTDANHTPLSYVNIILEKQEDSTFVAGCVTGDDGFFSLETKENDMSPKQLRTSFVGYKTKIIPVGSHFDGIIVLNEQSQVLREVTIKGHTPAYRMKDGILTSSIKSSVLSYIGTASDVLEQLPFITTRGNSINVFGKGKPLIYINSRLVRNEHELEQLKSEHIKDVQLIMNPGSQYDSEANAVIKITTTSPAVEGIGGSLSLKGELKNEFAYNSQLDLFYRKNKWDVFVTAYYDKDKFDQMQIDKTSFTHNSTSYKVDYRGNIKFQYNPLEISSGFNCAINSKQSVGMKYTYAKDFNVPASITCPVHLQENDIKSSFHSNNQINTSLNLYLIH